MEHGVRQPCLDLLAVEVRLNCLAQGGNAARRDGRENLRAFILIRGEASKASRGCGHPRARVRCPVWAPARWKMVPDHAK